MTQVNAIILMSSMFYLECTTLGEQGHYHRTQWDMLTVVNKALTKKKQCRDWQCTAMCVAVGILNIPTKFGKG